MKDIDKDRKMVVDGLIGERSAVPTRSRVTRSSDKAMKSVQSERNMKKTDNKTGRIKVDKAADKYIRHKGINIKDQGSQATKLKQIFQQPCTLPSKLDDFSSSCTPFRKVVEKKNKRKQREVVSKSSKKPCLEKQCQTEEEQKAEQQKHLESDCVKSDGIKAPSADIVTDIVVDTRSTDTVTGNTVKGGVCNVQVSKNEVRMNLSEYKYSGRKRMMYKNIEILHSNGQTSSEKTRKLEVDKETSDEHRLDSPTKTWEHYENRTKSKTSSEINYYNTSPTLHGGHVNSLQRPAVVNKTAADEELSASLQQREEEKVMEERLTEAKFVFCEICQKQLNHLSINRRHLHVNNCAERKEKEDTKRQQEAAKISQTTSVLGCPICGVPLKTTASRTSHLKKCAAKYKISTSDLMNIVRQQEKEPKMQARVLNKNQPTLTNKRQVRNRRLDQPKRLDEELQLAVALSTSLQEEQERQAQSKQIISEIPDNLTVSAEKPTIPDAFKVLMSPSKCKAAKRGRRKPKETLSILKYCAEETKLRLMTRMTNLILPQSEADGLTTTTGHWQYNNSQLGVIYTVVSTTAADPSSIPLWDRGSHERGVEGNKERDVSLYYVSQLMPPVEPHLVDAGAKLKRMSCIPGWDASDDKRNVQPHCTREMSGHDQSVGPMSSIMCDVPSTQTAAVLTALAAEAGHSQLTHDDTLIEVTTGGVSQGVEPVGYCQKVQEPSVTEGVLGALAQMVNNPILSDVTLKVQHGHILHAHKFMLVIRCPRLLELFEHDALSWLENYKEEAMMAVLRYIYVGDVSVLPSVVHQAHALAERLHLEDMAIVCREILRSQGETPCSETTAISGNDKMLVDRDLQHMLKDIWGSDSENSDVSNTSDGEEDAENEEEEMEELYKYMSTQRQKLKERHDNNTKPSLMDDNASIEHDRKTEGGVEVVTLIHRSPLSCESYDVDVVLKSSSAEPSPRKAGHSGCQYSPHGDMNTPQSMTIRSRSGRTHSVSDSHGYRSESEPLNLNTPTSSIITSRSNLSSPRLTRSKSKQSHQYTATSAAIDCGSTIGSVCKDLFSSVRETSPGRHSHVGTEETLTGDYRMDTSVFGSEESTTDLIQSCVPSEVKSDEIGLFEDREDVHLSSPSDVLVLSAGDRDEVQPHNSPTKTSTLDNSSLDLFESFLSDHSVEEPPIPPGDDQVYDGSTAQLQIMEPDSMEKQNMQNDSIYDENETDSVLMLEDHETLNVSTPVVEICRKKRDLAAAFGAPIDSTVVMEHEGDRRNLVNENNTTEVMESHKNRTNPTAFLLRLSSLLSESSNDDCPLVSPTQCSHSDGPSVSSLTCIRSESLGSSFSGSQTSSDTNEILSYQREIITTGMSLHTSLDQQQHVDGTRDRVSVSYTREPLSVRQRVQSSSRGNTGDNSSESECVAKDELPLYDTVDLTQDAASDHAIVMVTSGESGRNCLHTEDVMHSPGSSASDSDQDIMSAQARTQQVVCGKSRHLSSRVNRDSVQEMTVEVDSLTVEQLKDLIGDTEEDLTRKHTKDLSEDHIHTPTMNKVKDLARSEDHVKIHDPTEYLDLICNLTQDHTGDQINNLAEDHMRDPPRNLTEGFMHDPSEIPVQLLTADTACDLTADPAEARVHDLTGEDTDEGDSYYDPPTFVGDEYSSLMDKAGGTPQGRVKSPGLVYPPTSVQGGQVGRRQHTTPRPNLSSMETPELKAACHKIGVKAMPKKRMVRLLSHIYEETHKHLLENDFPIQNKTAAAGIGSKKNLVKDTGETKNRKRNTSSVSSEDTRSDMQEDVMVDTRMSPPSSPNKGLPYKRQQIRNFILTHEDIYLKILHYEPLESEDFRKQLKDSGIHVGAGIIMDFLDEQNVALTTRQNSGWRHKGAKQAKRRRQPLK